MLTPPAGLKYKLACGSLVFKFESTYKEFYEPALQDGVHVVKVPEDPDKFESETCEAGGGPEGDWIGGRGELEAVQQWGGLCKLPLLHD